MAYRRKLDKDIRCPLEYGLVVFGGNVTDAALAIALKDLAGNGLIERRQYEEIPPRVEYLLTDKGRSVIPVLQHICQWSGLYYKEDAGGADVRLSRCQRCDYRG